jgi:hypothetical protein
MRIFRRRETHAGRGEGTGQGGVATATATRGFTGTDAELWAEIESLSESNRARRSIETERRLLTLRNLAGIRRIEQAAADPEFPDPTLAQLPSSEDLPEVAGPDVTPELLRAGILSHGCLLVRGLVDRDVAAHFASQIDRSFTARERHDAGRPSAEGFYDEFSPDPRFGPQLARPWIKEGGGVLAVDAPRLNFEMMEMFRRAGLPELVEGYLGEPPLVSAQKTTLRKAEPTVGGAWHQDGKFMGDVRALNLWLSLSRCGDEAPGLDIVPRRLELVAAGTDDVFLDVQVSQRTAEEAAGEKGILRPIFEPGDALFFDELFLHQTGSDPSMPKPRFAIENWFFGGSAFPVEYAPIAI